MATENQQGDPATDSTETVDQEVSVQSEEETSKDETNQTQNQSGTESDSKSEQSSKDPAKQALLADLYKERDSRKALQAQVDKLTEEISATSQATEQLAAVQRRYDRLEEFLSKVGGPLGKALDSKSFTTKLFDTDDDISDMVKSWNKDNPSLTQVALGSTNVATNDTPSFNDLIRQAAK